MFIYLLTAHQPSASPLGQTCAPSRDDSISVEGVSVTSSCTPGLCEQGGGPGLSFPNPTLPPSLISHTVSVDTDKAMDLYAGPWIKHHEEGDYIPIATLSPPE